MPGLPQAFSVPDLQLFPKAAFHFSIFGHVSPLGAAGVGGAGPMGLDL